MGPLAAVERFLERLFERQSARLFRTAIRPVQVQRRLERVMEGERARDGGRTVVPHRFVVRLHPDDLAGLRASTPQLAATLADGALAFARSHGYTLLDRPVVAIRADPVVDTGDVAVEAGDWSRDGDWSRAGEDGPDAGPAAGVAPADGSIEDLGRADVASAVESEATPESGPPPADRTAVFVIPEIEGPRATIREIRADQSSRTLAFDGRPLTIGRATDNGLVLRDGRASRHHARVDVRRGSLVLSDLGSTNGSFVNDRRVDSIALREGDPIRIGTTTLLVEAIETAGTDPAPSGSAPSSAARATSGAPGGSAPERPAGGAIAG